MKCPHCDKEIPGSSCPQCGAKSPEGANYCMECGAAVDKHEEAVLEDEGDFDFESRVLCSDGTCTGIIEGGKCTECGKPV